MIVSLRLKIPVSTQHRFKQFLDEQVIRNRVDLPDRIIGHDVPEHDDDLGHKGPQ